MRYYLHIDPDKLDDYEWYRTYKALVWIRKEEAKSNSPKQPGAQNSRVGKRFSRR